jgi:hypothetical protein
MIHVAPAPGYRIIDPFTRAELVAGVMPDDPFWRRRADEGGVIITDPNAPPAPAPVAPATDDDAN